MNENRIVHRLEGDIIQPTLNASEIEIELAPDPENTEAEPVVKVNTVDFGFPNATTINNHNDAGANGNGVGINEGMRYSMSIDDGKGELAILDSYLVLSASSVVYSCDSVRGVPTELRGQNDSLSRRAKLVKYDILFDEGKITASDYIQIPYINSDLPDYRGAAIVTLTGFVVIMEIRRMVNDILKVIAEISSVLSAIAGVLKAVIIVLGIIVTIAAIIIFLFKIADQLIQPVKYHASMLWKKLIEIGCKELGLTFQSTIFDDKFIEDTVRLPAKFKSPEDPKLFGSFGFTVPEETKTKGYYDGSLFDLLAETKTTFRAFITLTSDDRLILEGIDTESKEPAFKMNPKIKMDEWSTNQEELIADYEVSLLLDESDNNTSNNYYGTKTNAVTTHVKTNDPKSQLIDGKKTVPLPFSRGFRKIELTPIEKALSILVRAFSDEINAVILVANTLISLRNSIVSAISKVVKKLGTIGIKIKFNPKVIPLLNYIPPDLFSNRIGMLLLSQDFFSVPKVLSLDISSNPRNTKVKTSNIDKWNSDYIYNTYHAGQSFVPSDRFPFGNQKRIFTALQTGVCKEDLVLMINNRSIFAPDGRKAKAFSWKQKVRTGNNNIVYRVPHIETTNLKITVTTPQGQ